MQLTAYHLGGHACRERCRPSQACALGNHFLASNKEWLADNLDVERPAPPAVSKTSTTAINSLTITENINLAGKGLSLEDIAARRGLKPTTVSGHLTCWLEEGNQLEIDQLLDRNKRNLLKEQFTILGTDFHNPWSKPWKTG